MLTHNHMARRRSAGRESVLIRSKLLSPYTPTWYNNTRWGYRQAVLFRRAARQRAVQLTRNNKNFLNGRLRLVGNGFLTSDDEYLFADGDAVNHALVVLFRIDVAGLRDQKLSDYVGKRKVRHFTSPIFA